MSNIHGLHSNRPRSPSPSDDENNRYVGGVDSRGGGSGLAVEPNPSSDPTNPIFNLATSANPTDAAGIRRTITMYRDGFTVDDGPYRRLTDPANAEFLTALARGRTPRELESEGSDITVGLVDKRNEDYREPERGFASFSGAGEALGGSGGGGDSGEEGVICPTTTSGGEGVGEEGGDSSVCVRLLSGKRLVVKIDKDRTVKELTNRINASGMAGTEPYVLAAGFPPRPIKDFSLSVKDAGLVGANVTQKKA